MQPNPLTPTELAEMDQRRKALIRKRDMLQAALDTRNGDLSSIHMSLRPLALEIALKFIELEKAKMKSSLLISEYNSVYHLVNKNPDDILLEFEDHCVRVGLRDWTSRYDWEFDECFQFSLDLLFRPEKQAVLDQELDACRLAISKKQQEAQLAQEQQERALLQSLQEKYSNG